MRQCPSWKAPELEATLHFLPERGSVSVLPFHYHPNTVAKVSFLSCVTDRFSKSGNSVFALLESLGI